MEQFNKKEFFEEYYQGDMYGLENAEEQMLSIARDVYAKEKANQTNLRISYAEVQRIAEELCEQEIKITKIQTMIKFVKELCIIFVETETTKYASDYYNMAFELYNKAFNDLMDLLGITDQDFKNFENGVDDTIYSKHNRPISRKATTEEIDKYLGFEKSVDNSGALQEYLRLEEKYANHDVDFCLICDYESGFFQNINIIETGKYILVYNN